MADKQIHELIQITVNATSISDVYMLQILDPVSGEWVSRCITAGDLGACIVSQISYPLVLETTAKTVLGAINELNGKVAYKDDDIVGIVGSVFPIYDDGTNYHFLIPLPKVVGGGLEASVLGDFTIDSILNSDALSTIGTVTTTITGVGIKVTITPQTHSALTNAFAVAETGAEIQFSEVV